MEETQQTDSRAGLHLNVTLLPHSKRDYSEHCENSRQTANNVTVSGLFRSTLRTSLHVPGKNQAFLTQIYDGDQTRTAE